MDHKLFDQLFILDMANNHQGDLAHGLAIIEALAKVAKKTGAKVCVKFQYRDYDTFIHPGHQVASTNKHIPRFLSTRLAADDFAKMNKRAKELGLITMCTPFDENSVDLIEQHGYDFLKIASCSVDDKPLIDRIAKTTLPIVCSSAGASEHDLDYVISKLGSHQLALMHCVGIYPTPSNELNLARVQTIANTYKRPTGFSTHETPSDLFAVQVAKAVGATIFERHIGLATDKYKLNAYSSTPAEVEAWIVSAQNAVVSTVQADARYATYLGDSSLTTTNAVEKESLASLKRGVYAAKAIAVGQAVKRSDVFFAIPYDPATMIHAGQFVEGTIAKRGYDGKEPI